MRKFGILAVLMFGFAASPFAQEYDDMYFNSTDREKAKKNRKKEFVEFESADDFQFQDSYAVEKTIEDYQDEAADISLEYQSPYNSTNSIISNNALTNDNDPLSFQYSGSGLQDAYDQGYEDGLAAAPTISNNYYGGANVLPRWQRMGFPYYDPFFYDNWGAWGGGFGLSVGWGWGWNNWGWNSWSPWAYDPWFYNNWGWSRPFVYSDWAWRNRFWGNNWYCPPIVSVGYIANNTPSKQREVINGPRGDRGGLAQAGNVRPSRGSPGLETGRTDNSRNTYSRLDNSNGYNRRVDTQSSSRPTTNNPGYTRRIPGRENGTNSTTRGQSNRMDYTRKNDSHSRGLNNGSSSQSGYNRNYGNTSTNSNVRTNPSRSSGSSTYRAPATRSSGSSSRGSATRSSSGSSRSSGGVRSSGSSSRSSGSRGGGSSSSRGRNN